MKDLIKSVYESPQDWSIDAWHFKHKSGFMVWTANGFMFLKPEGKSIHVTFLQKIKLWIAYKWWCSNAPLAK